MIGYAITSMVHSMFLILMGFVSAWLIFSQMVTWETSDGSVDVTYDKGWRALLFGILVGTTDYFAGNVTKGLAKYIMLSLGLNEHKYDNLDNNTVEITTLSKEGITYTSD